MSKFKGKQAFKRKLARRIMALVLSGAMVMSNMSAYATELATEKETEIVSEVEETVAADTAEEESVSGEKDENAETEDSVAKTDNGQSAEEISVASEDKAIQSEDDTEETESEDNKTEIIDTGMALPEETEITEAFTEEETEEKKTERDNTTENSYVFDFSDIPNFAKGTYASGDKIETDDYFTIYCHANSILEDKNITFSDDYTSVKRFATGGSISASQASIGFQTTGPAKLKVWWVANGSERYMQVMTADKSFLKKSTEDGTSSDCFIYEEDILEAGTYYVGSSNSSLYICKIEVIEEGSSDDNASERGDWENDVDDPEIIAPIEYAVGDSDITVTVKGVINKAGVGADKLTVNMYKENDDDEPVDSQSKTTNTTEDEDSGDHLSEFTFTPEESGSYYFQAVLSRSDGTDDNGEAIIYTDKESDSSDVIEFTLPLAKPVITTASFKEIDDNGKGTITVAWNAVTEADNYKVSLIYTDDANKSTTIAAKETEKTSIDISGLEINSVVSITVQALRGEATAAIDKSEESEAREVTISESKTPIYTIDITEGLKTETTYGGEDDILTFTVLENMDYKNDESNPDNGYYYVQGSTNPGYYKTPDATSLTSSKGDVIPTHGAAFVIEATKSAKMTFDLYVNGAKTYYLMTKSGTKAYETSGSLSLPAGEKYTVQTVEFDLHAGETYYFYVASSKVMVQGISYTKNYIYEQDLFDEENLKETNGTYTTTDGKEYTISLKTGTTYGDADLATFTVMDNMGIKTDSKTAVTYKYAQGENNPTTNGKSSSGTIPDAGAAFKITTVKSAEITFDLFFNGSKTYYLVNESGNHTTVSKAITATETAPVIETVAFTLYAGETYYFYVSGSKAMVQGIYLSEWYSGEEEPEIPVERGDWADVAAPEIVNIEQIGGTLAVTVKGVIDKDGNGADSLTVEMYNANHLELKDPQPLSTSKAVTTATTADADGNHLTTVTFTVSESGSYAFKAILSRADETITDDDGNETTVTYEDKTSDYSDSINYKLPLDTPVISTVKNLDADADGNGVISVAWDKVTEAERYAVLVTDESGNEIATGQTEGTSAQIGGLPISSTVVITVKAFRDNEGEGVAADESEWSAAKTITVSGKEPNTYTFDATDYELGVMTAGTKLGTENYFTLMIDSSLSGSAELKNASTGNYIEINKYGSTGIKFTVYGTADASFTVASTGNSNQSAFGLVNADGVMVEGTISGTGATSVAAQIYESDTETKGTAYIAYGTATSSIDYINLPAGTYTFLSPYAGYSRGGRVHGIVVYDSGDMAERGSWDEVDAPVISEISYVKGESVINVTASGYVAYDGADSLKVDMYDADNNIVETVVKATESTENEDGTITNADQEFVFTPKASGDYGFRASLVRSDSEDIVMADSMSDWTIKDFVLPLDTPSVSSMTNIAYGEDGTQGGLEVIFAGVDEADYYVVAAFSDTSLVSATKYFDIDAYTDAEDAENKIKLGSARDDKQAYTVMLDGLDLGTCYIVVQAFRNVSSSLNLKAETTVITRGEDGKPVSKTDYTKQEGVSTSVAVSETDEETRNAIAVVRSEVPDGREKYINGKNDTRWFHSVFGSNTTRSTYSRAAGLNAFDGEYDGTAAVAVPANGYQEYVYEDGENKGDLKSVTLWSENGRGKVVPASTDGLSYYYTSINPSENNFTLSALMHVKSWQYSNGQDGFGMMVSDTVGKDGDSGDTWTNAYQLLASKIQYSWYRADYAEDGVGYVTDAGGNGVSIMRYEMKLGVGWNSKEGATASDVAKIKSGALTAPVNFTTDSGTLETSAGNNDLYTGSYNVIGNGYNTIAIPTSSVKDDSELLTDVRFQIQKYDNAYVLRYLELDAVADLTDEEKESGDYAEMNGEWYKIIDKQVFSDDNNNKLTQVDKQNIYVGFFAARYARVDISQIDLDVTPSGADEFPIPTIYVDPSASFSSEETSNSASYDLAFSANFDGTLTIYKEDADGMKTVTTGKAITANTKYTFTSTLNTGETKFTYYAQPNENYVPGENQELKNFNMQTGSFTVIYHAFEGDEIYVAQNGALVGTSITVTDENGEEKTVPAGSKENPTNVYDAVNYAAAGQTILLAGGIYDLASDAYSKDGSSQNLLIGMGHDGTSRKYITMKADPEATQRPVLDFGQSTQKNDTAFTMAGNYWYFEGFDVMGSQDGQKGILLAGSYNILNDLRTYLNGNTGVQIARYSNNGREDWPSYNTVLNCSSFMNYDAGYEDADGFAAKLTCGDGNKFVGCIAAYNADDGWDLYAKVESGSIGVVTIENCLAFKNGYLFGEEDYYGSGSDLIYRYTDFSRYTKNTHLVNAGNGNGFKMGGDSMSGYHVLKNSIAFGNKSKGIDSNSCPDIQIYNSITFNNEANNVAMYTSAAVNTDYYAENLVSIKDSTAESGYSTAENITPLGTQNLNKIYSSTSYYWSGSKSVNSDGKVFDLSWFESTSITNAIFGSNKITRSSDGSIVLNGFLEYTDTGREELGLTESSVIGSTPAEDVLDAITDIYVFAADYSKNTSTLNEIKLSSYDATKALAEKGYTWTEPDTLIAAYAGTTAEFTVSATGKQDRTVAVSFIQLDGAELQIVSGDANGNEVLDYDETWTIEAVPVISPAVEPDVEMSGFSAAIVDGSKGLLKAGTAATGTVNPNLKVASAQNTFAGTGSNGDAKLTATVSLTAGGKTVKQTAALTFAVKNGEGIKFDSINPTDDSIIKWDSNTDSDYIQVAMDKTNEFTLNNLHFVKLDENKEQVPADFGKGVKISVNDTSVIKLKSTASSANGVDATFTVVNKSGDGGTATVTVTSKADKSLVRNYIVTISGSEFAWTAGTVEIDKAKTAGIQLTALAPFGRSMNDVANDSTSTNEDGSVTEFKGITVNAVYKGTKVSGSTVAYSNYFEAKQITGNVYELNTTASAVASLPKGTYTVVYQAEVPKTVTTTNEDGETTTVTEGTEKVAFTPITINVTETKPTVTFKQSKKVNLFYNNGTSGSTGTLTATSKQGAVTVTASNSNYFRFSNNGAGYDIVSIKKNPVSLTSSGAADYKDVKQNSKVTLTAHVDGYYTQYDVTKPFTVGLEYKQPKLKLTALDKTIYTAIGMNSADILIYDPDSEMYLNTDAATIELVTDPTAKKAYSKANSDFTVGEITSSAFSGNGVKLTVNSNTVKGGAVKLSITYDDWFSEDPVIVSQSIKVTDKVPKLTIKPAKLNINTVSFVGKEQVSAQILLNGTAGFTISDLSLTGANSKAAEFMKFVDYDVITDTDGNTVLLVSLKATAEDGTAFPATADSKGIYKMNAGYASSYGFTASYKLGSVEQTANFKLSLVSKEAVTVSTKGSINIVDRANSTVILKPKAQNFTAKQVSNVTLTGDAANQFEIVEFDRSTGETTIRAKETADLKKGSYKILPVFTYDLGVSGTCAMAPIKPVVIKTTQPALRISGLKDALEVKLSSPNTAAQRTITVGSPAGAYILDMTQTSGLNNFALSYDAGGNNVIVTIKNRAGLKEGTTYKITATLTVEGSGSNVKQQVITIPVKVIR